MIDGEDAASRDPQLEEALGVCARRLGREACEHLARLREGGAHVAVVVVGVLEARDHDERRLQPLDARAEILLRPQHPAAHLVVHEEARRDVRREHDEVERLLLREREHLGKLARDVMRGVGRQHVAVEVAGEDRALADVHAAMGRGMHRPVHRRRR